VTPPTEQTVLPAAFQRLGALGMLAVLRGNDPDRVSQAACVLIDSGIDVLEITFTVPDCAEIIAHVKAERPDAVVGAGTVLSWEHVAAAASAGADFLVTPGATQHLIESMLHSGKPFLPGVLTPSEVMHALDLGAPGVKLFPGAVVGPQGLSAIRGPFPDLIVVPTGGVSPENVNEWRSAGAFAVGAGSNLASPQAIDSGDHEQLRANARTWLSALSG
jgi:2-dehydro-3-deoxyphosphogluconate aldolase / (4S)-4-hydroxy-2-oxoglutarate aldolase